MALARSGFALTLGMLALAASANNLGENGAWQFQTSTDKANQAAVQDMIQKRKSGYYAAPAYTTNIDRQYNCNVAPTAVGNEGTNSTLANSPSTTGVSATATGNANTTQVRGDGSQVEGTPVRSGGSQADTGQTNTGAVGSFVRGSTSTDVRGWADQALNSDQNNSGNQTANVSGSSACAFGALN
jgi:hypothetical protein